ncbi:hypothetical protein BAY06_02400 [Elizabethkingia anophelis]|uniref:hypothetical protein n=1 Tax=Elizabethkingia anophelis TaxID=1117645 RepID=UPI00099A1463|nr:hypothetical protein [Elizabethkingia anophelis]OPC52963.1 hypothetical protein BAY06_02400 [Elizabethkingia anophelis]
MKTKKKLKKYTPPVIEMIKVEMEACIPSLLNFINDNGVNRRWGSMGKYSDNININKNKKS